MFEKLVPSKLLMKIWHEARDKNRQAIISLIGKDGRYKYVFHCVDGEQQLFDLRDDPGELRDLASAPEHKAKVKLWRSRMIEHLAERGEPFVVAGDLGLRPSRTLYSPHYPGHKR